VLLIAAYEEDESVTDAAESDLQMRAEAIDEDLDGGWQGRRAAQNPSAISSH
jgi:hypothetical protein